MCLCMRGRISWSILHDKPMISDISRDFGGQFLIPDSAEIYRIHQSADAIFKGNDWMFSILAKLSINR